ncbi:tRNA lysidine(34) synthetase TilS [Mucilaginibacter sp. RS28]|uniref:tRNA(Ile)-lysidine synthase n=1 Tax=Mucilaginibacter straminoryzae TaxID=2932774 RepID=A0A9X2BEH6_9SPHI|nr:tRNA lysidine(34) synthetase TilS [Mucilaginibacter straminoryzae]MCJ8211413.1 tRNA lysidine(34) synthetase TilS [Mucilaginibacter straminoryzae]
MLPVTGFKTFAEQNRLFNANDKIIAAVSGGKDSVLMAHLLKAAGHHFVIAHCNFQLRAEESRRDEAFCHLLAQNLGVEFYTQTFQTQQYAQQHGVSIQMAARDLRYQWFEQLRQRLGFNLIALAHHQNDAIETILLNLTRGTGIAGLHGIRPRNGNLVRPLLFLTRKEVDEIIVRENLDYAEDSSNASTKYARNKIRHEVVPKLKELNPNLEQTFQNHLQHFAELEELLQLKVDEVREDLFTYTKGEIHLPLSKLRLLKPLHLLLNELLKPYGFIPTTISDVIEALDKHAGRRFEGDGWLLVLDREQLILSPQSNYLPTNVQVNANDETCIWGTYQFKISHTSAQVPIPPDPAIAMIDSDQLIFPLTVRSWELSDAFRPLGMESRKKLSDFFIARKIPLHRKSRIPIVVNGNGEIIWIAGLRLDDRYKITAATKNFSIFELSEI